MADLDKRRFILGAAGAALASGMAGTARALPVAKDPQAAYFTNAILTTHDGRRVRFYDDLLKDRNVVINMMYTTCSGICPANTASVKAVREQLGARAERDIVFYSISLRPEMDTPAELAAYRKRYEITSRNWIFLTGRSRDIELIRRRLGFYDIDPRVDADLSQHTGMLRIGKVANQRWAMCPTASSTSQIVDSILGVV